MNRFYVVIRAIAGPVVRLLFPFDVVGLENLAAGEKLVLCANHASGWDPVLLCVALPGRFRIRIMAKKQLMEIPVLGWILKKLGVFGVDRGHSDMNAVKTAIRAVRDGENLLIFPEGTRVAHEGDVRPKGGVVMIAMRTGASLGPVYAGGKKRLFRRSRLVFGRPYQPQTQTQTRHGTAEEYQRYADEVMRRAYALGRGEREEDA